MDKTTLMKRFGKNLFWLFLFNNLGYVFSFLTFPILISKFGLEQTGIIFTIQTLMLALVNISNYSFVYYIPTQSQIVSEQPSALVKLWQLVFSTRLFFSMLLALISTMFVWFFFNSFMLFWLMSLSILGAKVIQPNLLFNALEKNDLIFKIGFFNKLLFVILVFFSTSSIQINLFFGFSELVVLLFFISKPPLSIGKLRWVGMNRILKFLYQTYHLFLLSFFSMLKPASIVPIISFFLGNASVTLYTLAEKVINVLRSVSGAMFVSFYPIYEKENFNLSFSIRSRKVWLIVAPFFLVALVWWLSPYFIYVLNDFQYHTEATKTLRVLSLSIPSFFMVIPLFSFLLQQKSWGFLVVFALLQLLVLWGLLFLNHHHIVAIAGSFVVSEYVLLLCYLLLGYFLKNARKTSE